MSLYEKLQQDLKQAMLSRDEVARDTLRMVIAAVKKHELEGGKTITDELVQSVLQSAAKTRLESIEQFDKAARTDLSTKEKNELEVVRKYLPKQLDEAQTKAVVERTIKELSVTSKKDVGVVMKAVMAAHKGEVDGKLVQRIASSLLA